jgi:hypothetical protein
MRGIGMDRVLFVLVSPSPKFHRIPVTDVPAGITDVSVKETGYSGPMGGILVLKVKSTVGSVHAAVTGGIMTAKMAVRNTNARARRERNGYIGRSPFAGSGNSPNCTQRERESPGQQEMPVTVSLNESS